MVDITEIFLYLFLGTFSGILAGLFGIGGGIIIIPALFFTFGYLGFEQEIISHMVIGTSLGIIVFSSISSTYSHNRRKVVVWDLIKIVGPSIFIGSALGAITADQLSSETLRSLIAIFLILVSIQMAFQFPPPKQNPSTTVTGPLTVGLGIGWLSGIFGIGGGVFSVPYFFHRGFSMTQSIGSSAACGIPIAISGSISYMLVGSGNHLLPENTFGYVYFPAMILVGIASLLTAKVGVKAAHRIKQKKLRKAFALLVMIMGIRLLMT